MKVLQVIASSDRGGGSDHVLGLVRELLTLDVEIEVATSPDGYLIDDLAALGVRTHPIDMMRSRIDPRIPLALRRCQASVRADVVHCHGTRAAVFAHAARLDPIVYTAHGLAFEQAGRLRQAIGLFTEMIACRSSDVISVSRLDLEALGRRRLLPRGKGHHISNAVDAVAFAPGDQDSARAAAGLPTDGLLVGTVARLVPQKGVDVLIEAVRNMPAATAIVIGDGPLRADLERQAAPLGDRVRFLGMRDDVAALLPALDAFVLPSRWEGEPIALLQAMASGLPCIATATGGSMELLGDDRGLVIAIDDPSGLAEAIRTLAEHPDRRSALGQAARAFAQQRSWTHVAERVVEIYRTLLSHRPLAGAGGPAIQPRYSK
jgi:glycosyltransferase involved in cell wall biosynthesis